MLIFFYKIIPSNKKIATFEYIKKIIPIFQSFIKLNIIKFNDNTCAICKDEMYLVIYQYLSEYLTRDYCRHSHGKWQYCTWCSSEREEHIRTASFLAIPSLNPVHAHVIINRAIAIDNNCKDTPLSRAVDGLAVL